MCGAIFLIMRLITVFRNLLLATLMLISVAVAEGPWVTEVAEGLKKAKAEEKLVLVLFTGSEWSEHSKNMDKDVFSKKTFLDDAQKAYVLVNIDTPEKIEKSVKKLMMKYGVRAFPTAVLLDADGKKFASFAAAQEASVKDFLARLSKEKRRKVMF